MTDAEARDRLSVLETDYHGQPVIARRADLCEINKLRAALNMSLVDENLRETDRPAVVEAPAPKDEPKPDHTAARAVYERYLARVKELEPHLAYADRISRATHAPCQTPVKPLATMGTGGGPLLCDHCGKAILLEGGKFHNVPADVAWQQNPDPNWKSWISGGMVVDVVSNGTLRIYHGYIGRPNHCCDKARAADNKREAEFASEKTPRLLDDLLAFFADEFPQMTERGRFDLLNAVLNTLYSYDPGIGVNRPS